MRAFILRILLLALVLGASLPLLAQDQEQDQEQQASPPAEVIHSYDSRILLRADGSMRVVETIRVTAAHEQINHGIYRDYPTHYRDRWGERVDVKFDFIGAKRDGQAEDWSVEGRDNGVRVKIGNKETLVPVGEHTYELTYETNRQVGFFKDHDELYWNVTGNGWLFPIEHATAEVTLPGNLQPAQITLAGYTGPAGSKAQDFTGEVDAQGISHFASTRRLDAYEGLTIVVMFPKGIVTEPSRQQRIGWFFDDNKPALVALIGLLIGLIYQFGAWSAVGKDPAPGTVMVRYTPPDGFSPGAIRYLRRMGYDDKVFAALVVDMGVKGYLRLDQDKDGKFKVARLKHHDDKVLSDDEAILAGTLFENSELVEFEQINHTRIKSTIDAVKKTLGNRLEQHYFVTNAKYMWPSLAIMAGTFLAVLSFSDAEMIPVALFMCVWLSIWSIGVAALLVGVVGAWKHAMHARGWGKLSYGSALFLTAFALPFLAGEIFGLGMFARATSIVATAVLAAFGVSQFIFHDLLKAPTHTGRDLLDQVDGFREFIGATEDVARNYPLDRSPTTFEKFLPYAMAMDLEEVWTAKFATVLAAAAAAGAAAAHGYSPAWTNMGGSNFSSFGSDLGGSLSSAISSSSTAPGSSSGGGGGGSSGGGGGGGGGGGW